MYLSALSLALNRPGAVSLEQVVASLFANNEQGAWYDPSAANVTWRRNLLTYTEQFDNAAWTLTGSPTVSANTVDTTDPLGGNTADKFVSANASAAMNIAQSFTTTAVEYVFSVYAKAAGATVIQFLVSGATAGFVNFDLANKVVGDSSLFVGTITELPNGWFRCIARTGTVTATASSFRIALVNAANAVRNAAFTGNGTNGVYLWGAQLEANVTTATAYQRIVTPEITYLSTVQAQPLLFQNAEGTLPVTEVEQPVGLMLDRRKGLALGPERITNGTFDTDLSGWIIDNNLPPAKQVTWTASGARIQNDGTSGNITFRQADAFEANKSYKVTFTITVAAGAVDVQRGNTIFATVSASGSYSYIVTGSTLDRLAFLKSTLCDVTIDNVSVKLLDGNHAYQTGSAARPVLRARYNLLTYSEQFDNATAWGTQANGCTVVANATVAPDGTTTADKIEEDNSNFTHHRRGQSIGTGPERRFSIYAKKAERDYLRVWSFAGGDTTEQTFYLVGTGSATGTLSPTITPVGNGWYRCECNVPGANATLVIGPAPVGNLNTSTYQGVAGSGIYVWGADLRVGTSAGDYQRIAAATDYATTSTITGQPFRPYLNFDAADGTADSLFTASVDFSATDKMFFAASVQKANDLSIGAICELSATTNTNNGAFVVFASENSAPNYAFGLRGTDYGYYRATTYTAPITNVLSCVYDIAGSTSADEIKPQVNKAVPSLSFQNNVAGTGNFGNYPLYIGRRNNNSVPFTGRVFGMLIRGAATTASQVSAAEDYMAGKAGLTL